MNYFKKIIKIGEICKKEGIQKACNTTYRSLFVSLYKKYHKFEGYFNTNVISNPYQVIEVPLKKINNAIDTYSEYKLVESRINNSSHKIKNNLDSRIFKTNSPLRHGIIMNQKIRLAGYIEGGDWDKYITDIKNLVAFRAFYQRFVERKEWKNTIYYEKETSRFNLTGSFRGGKQSYEEFYKKDLKRWDKLYDEIKNCGYFDQSKLGGDPTNEIQVVVSSDGEILFRSSKHRLVIAKILGIKKIPVIVNVWHKEYINWFKNAIKIKNPTPKQAIKPIIK